MTPSEAFAALRRLKPEAALAFLRQRGQITQTWSWADLLADEHALQFTVSRLLAVDLLAELHQLIIDSVDGDLSRRDFMLDAKRALVSKGWWGMNEVQDTLTGAVLTTVFNPTRLKLIYDTNLRQAAAAGQWERAQATKRLFPYLRYVTLADEKVRDSHRQWHNLVLPVDAPFWLTHMPQNAYRCRCYVRQVSQREYDRGTTPTGQKMIKTAPPEKLREWVNPRTGETQLVPDGVHPAFAGNAGAGGVRAQALQRAAAEKLLGLPPALQPGASSLLARPVPPPGERADD